MGRSPPGLPWLNNLKRCPIPLKNKDQESLSVALKHSLPSHPAWPQWLLVSPHAVLCLLNSCHHCFSKVPRCSCLRAFARVFSITRNIGPLQSPCFDPSVLKVLPPGSLFIPTSLGPFFHSTDQPSGQALLRECCVVEQMSIATNSG